MNVAATKKMANSRLKRGEAIGDGVIKVENKG